MPYGYTKQIDMPFTKAVEAVRAELAREGFGVLTEIDVKATLKKKLDVAYGDYVILGACNPSFAHQALQKEKEIGLLMPCNVIVYEDAGNVFVSAILPTAIAEMVDNPALRPIAGSVEEKLKVVINRITSSSA